jgi:hypothetical protein
MATVLLSISTNTFSGIYMSVHSGTLTRRLVHPTSPVLLTRNGPLRAYPFSGIAVHLSNRDVLPI